jgi:hypothetical protein
MGVKEIRGGIFNRTASSTEVSRLYILNNRVGEMIKVGSSDIISAFEDDRAKVLTQWGKR